MEKIIDFYGMQLFSIINPAIIHSFKTPEKRLGVLRENEMNLEVSLNPQNV